jgi:hypothetical protein
VTVRAFLNELLFGNTAAVSSSSGADSTKKKGKKVKKKVYTNMDELHKAHTSDVAEEVLGGVLNLLQFVRIEFPPSRGDMYNFFQRGVGVVAKRNAHDYDLYIPVLLPESYAGAGISDPTPIEYHPRRDSFRRAQIVAEAAAPLRGSSRVSIPLVISATHEQLCALEEERRAGPSSSNTKGNKRQNTGAASRSPPKKARSDRGGAGLHVYVGTFVEGSRVEEAPSASAIRAAHRRDLGGAGRHVGVGASPGADQEEQEDPSTAATYTVDSSCEGGSLGGGSPIPSAGSGVPTGRAPPEKSEVTAPAPQLKMSIATDRMTVLLVQVKNYQASVTPYSSSVNASARCIGGMGGDVPFGSLLMGFHGGEGSQAYLLRCDGGKEDRCLGVAISNPHLHRHQAVSDQLEQLVQCSNDPSEFLTPQEDPMELMLEHCVRYGTTVYGRSEGIRVHGRGTLSPQQILEDASDLHLPGAMSLLLTVLDFSLRRWTPLACLL